MCVTVAASTVYLFGMRGERCYENECVIGTAGWLKAVSRVPRLWLCPLYIFLLHNNTEIIKQSRTEIMLMKEGVCL